MFKALGLCVGLIFVGVGCGDDAGGGSGGTGATASGGAGNGGSGARLGLERPPPAAAGRELERPAATTMAVSRVSCSVTGSARTS